MKNKLSIIIPIFNEKNNILILTKKIIFNLKKIKYEIIYVDDNSLDHSKKVLSELKRRYKFFKPILRKKKRDLTQSCFEGIEKAKYENILVMDGDLQHNPKYIKKMLLELNKRKLDVVIGARKLLSGKNQGLSEIRRFTSIALIFFFKIFKINTNDPMSGFFIFKKRIYVSNKKNFYGRGFKILADILINSKINLKTKDIIINFERRYDSKSKMNFKILYILMKFYFFSLFKNFKLFSNVL